MLSAALTPLPRIPYLRLRFTLRAEEPARLPPYKGSTLRGGFGHALRKTVCVMGPGQPCQSCLVRRLAPPSAEAPGEVGNALISTVGLRRVESLVNGSDDCVGDSPSEMP